MGIVSDPILLSFAIGALGFVTGAGFILMIPRQQSWIKLAIIAIAALMLLLDFAGFKLVEFGSAIDPNDPERVPPLSELLGPRFGFLGFLVGLISFGIGQTIQTTLCLLLIGSILMGGSGGLWG